MNTFKRKEEECGGNDDNEWDDQDDQPCDHYSDKGGHQERGENQKPDWDYVEEEDD